MGLDVGPVRRVLRRARGHHFSSFPCTTSGGEYSIVQGLDIDDFSRTKIDASAAELVSERDTVKGLGLI